MTASLEDLAARTRAAAGQLATLSSAARDSALTAMADSLTAAAPEILAANAKDCDTARSDGISGPLYARLKLDDVKLRKEIEGVRDVGSLPDPVGHLQIHRELDQGLVLRRITVPMGVLGVIFEARPDAVIQIAALAIKSGNGAILKGGKEAVRSCRAIVQALQQGLAGTSVDPAALLLLTTREETMELLRLDAYVDLIIPRGSNSFVRYVQDHTRIPVLGHAEGICHLYVDSAADPDMAIALAIDSKTQYPAACNSIETMLVHREIAPSFLPLSVTALQAQGVSILADDDARDMLKGFRHIDRAGEEDWSTEYSDLIVSIRVVGSLDAAIDHINTYGSGHTDAIATEDPAAAQAFLSRVDSAGVYHNASTRFSDGFRYGFGAEVGISTQKMPPRGPVGLEGLVTYKYVLVGDGHTVAMYSGAGARAFTHRELWDA